MDKIARVLFPSKDSKGSAERARWIETIGTWKYDSLILADFDPLKAERIYMESTALQIYTALASKRAYFHD